MTDPTSGTIRRKWPNKIPAPQDFPDRIFLLGYSFSVEYYDDMIPDEYRGGFDDGDSAYSEQVIRIVCGQNYSRESIEKTFIHEVVHCITKLLDVHFGDNDEHYVDLLATGVHSLVRDNLPFWGTKQENQK